jgi:4-amino-4-deoxy-L-arabinose transferase-like glycosyltransferase
MMAGLTLRIYRLADRSLWFDEAYTWRLINFPFIEMIQRSQLDNSPPFYYILLQSWASVFGDSAFALRFLSVLCGELTIIGIYLFAVEAFGKHLDTGVTSSDQLSRCRGIGLLTAAFVALSALQIRYSCEIRMYALAAALAVFSSWALFRALRSPSYLRRWLLYGFFALLLTYTHYYGLFTVAAQAIFVAAVLLTRMNWDLLRLFRSLAFRHALFAAALVIAGWLPWLPTFLHQHAQVKESFWSHSMTRWDAAELCYRMFIMPESFPPPPRSWQLFTADVCLLGLWCLRRKARAAERYVICSAVLPLFLSLTFSAPATLRYFIISQLFLLIGLAVLIWRISPGFERAIAIAVSLILFTGIYYDFWRALDVAHKPGTQGAAEFLRQQRRPGEPVIACMPFLYLPLLHYASDKTNYYLYSAGNPMPHHYGTAVLTEEELITEEQLRRLRSRRIWVVNTANGQWGIRSVPAPANWKAKARHVFPEVVRLGDVILVEYEIISDRDNQ